ncbi:DNA cytosine methyltransferase [Chromohalobacter salexigens]|nr:DNA cytosine methyltransferase [Chromohalobacter salexigens]
MLEHREIRHFHLFCGLGAGAKGFNRGHARVGNLEAHFRCIGGVDVDPAAIADFGRLAGTPGTALDMFDRDQYRAFHGKEPPADWNEATPADIQAAAGNESPHIVFLSAPCKGFSGLLSQSRSTTPKYQALNRLTLRGMWLALEAFADDPPELFVFENVPRIANRGRPLLDQIVAMLEHYGYHVAETTHDCGELGGLAQSRKRFLLVARHAEKVPPFLYEPVKRPLRAVGDVLGDMPLPGDELAGAMHRVPRLQWKTWVRLAFVEAGSDWRSLNKLAVEDGYLSDYLIVPEYRGGYMGVNQWDEPMGTVAGRSTPTNGAFSVADPRFEQSAQWNHGQAYGVRRWDETTGAVTGQQTPGQGSFSVADPRPPEGLAFTQYGVQPWTRHSGVVTGQRSPGQGVFSVADPRPGMRRSRGDNYLTGGHYGVVPWSSSCGAVSASARQDNGHWSVADPRLPEPTEKLAAVIRALDGTWHRPFTTLELAALQGLIEPTEHLELAGLSDSDWRERIGNAVPPPASEAIAGVMGTTLLLAWTGETFALGSTPIWVRQAATVLSLSRPDQPVAH